MRGSVVRQVVVVATNDADAAVVFTAQIEKNSAR